MTRPDYCQCAQPEELCDCRFRFAVPENLRGSNPPAAPPRHTPPGRMRNNHSGS